MDTAAIHTWQREVPPYARERRVVYQVFQYNEIQTGQFEILGLTNERLPRYVQHIKK